MNSLEFKKYNNIELQTFSETMISNIGLDSPDKIDAIGVAIWRFTGYLDSITSNKKYPVCLINDLKAVDDQIFNNFIELITETGKNCMDELEQGYVLSKANDMTRLFEKITIIKNGYVFNEPPVINSPIEINNSDVVKDYNQKLHSDNEKIQVTEDANEQNIEPGLKLKISNPFFQIDLSNHEKKCKDSSCNIIELVNQVDGVIIAMQQIVKENEVKENMDVIDDSNDFNEWHKDHKDWSNQYFDICEGIENLTLTFKKIASLNFTNCDDRYFHELFKDVNSTVLTLTDMVRRQLPPSAYSKELVFTMTYLYPLLFELKGRMSENPLPFINLFKATFNILVIYYNIKNNTDQNPSTEKDQIISQLRKIPTEEEINKLEKFRMEAFITIYNLLDPLMLKNVEVSTSVYVSFEDRLRNMSKILLIVKSLASRCHKVMPFPCFQKDLDLLHVTLKNFIIETSKRPRVEVDLMDNVKELEESIEIISTLRLTILAHFQNHAFFKLQRNIAPPSKTISPTNSPAANMIIQIQEEISYNLIQRNDGTCFLRNDDQVMTMISEIWLKLQGISDPSIFAHLKGLLETLNKIDSKILQGPINLLNVLMFQNEKLDETPIVQQNKRAKIDHPIIQLKPVFQQKSVNPTNVAQNQKASSNISNSKLEDILTRHSSQPVAQQKVLNQQMPIGSIGDAAQHSAQTPQQPQNRENMQQTPQRAAQVANELLAPYSLQKQQVEELKQLINKCMVDQLAFYQQQPHLIDQQPPAIPSSLLQRLPPEKQQGCQEFFKRAVLQLHTKYLQNQPQPQPQPQTLPQSHLHISPDLQNQQVQQPMVQDQQNQQNPQLDTLATTRTRRAVKKTERAIDYENDIDKTNKRKANSQTPIETIKKQKIDKVVKKPTTENAPTKKRTLEETKPGKD